MKFTHYDLGYQQKGAIVEITLSGSAANVRLMNSSNFSNFQYGREHHYYGGLAKRSPVRLPIPNSGNWHVTVDMSGLVGTVRSSMRILPSPLPELRQTPLSDVPSLVRKYDEVPNFDGSKSEKEYDVFISHASEDKDEIVRPLALALIKEGLEVWYDEFELKIGDSLRKKIDIGLAKSKFGIVVLSKSFFTKGWTNYELDGIVTKAVSREQIILPIWHNITKRELIDYSPSLADKVARNTSSNTVEEIASEIAEVIKR